MEMGAPEDLSKDPLDRALEPFEPEDLLLPDGELEDLLDAVPENENTDDMITQMLDILHVHISEVYSQPRITALAHEHGLAAGTAFDLLTNDDTGKPWNFDYADQRANCKQKIIDEKPYLLVGSPMRTAFSRWQAIATAPVGARGTSYLRRSACHCSPP